MGLMPLAISCAPVTGSLSAYCDARAPLADAHAEALLVDGGDQSVQTGAALIGVGDAVCG